MTCLLLPVTAVVGFFCLDSVERDVVFECDGRLSVTSPVTAVPLLLATSSGSVEGRILMSFLDALATRTGCCHSTAGRLLSCSDFFVVVTAVVKAPVEVVVTEAGCTRRVIPTGSLSVVDLF